MATESTTAELAAIKIALITIIGELVDPGGGESAETASRNLARLKETALDNLQNTRVGTEDYPGTINDARRDIENHLAYIFDAFKFAD